MPKKAKRAKRLHKVKRPGKHIRLWTWIIISIPLIIGILWAVSILYSYDDLPLAYEQASPSSIKTVLGLIFTFIVSYGAFVFMEFKKTVQTI